MGTLCTVLIITIPWITNGLNTYTTDGDTYWRSQNGETFVPLASSAYGTIRLRQHIKMSLHMQWNGRTSSELTYEQIFRIGWESTSGSCSAQNSRYPSLWIDNMEDVFHLAVSQQDSCGQGWRISSYPLERHQIYAVHIEFTDSKIFMSINDTVALNQTRDSPTNPSFIGKLMTVYIASDHWNIPYVIADTVLWNIDILSSEPTIVPTAAPTHIPTPDPTAHPTSRPTKPPSITPTVAPSQATTNPSYKPSVAPVSSTQSTTKLNHILPKTNVSKPIEFVTNHESTAANIDMSEILYLLIAGIASCLLGTLLIFIAVKKCGDMHKGHSLSAQRLGLALRRAKFNTEDSFSHAKQKVCIPLKPAKEPDMLKLAPPHPVPAVPAPSPCNPPDKYVITISNPLESVYNVVDEGNESSRDTTNETETENETQIMGTDGMDGMDCVDGIDETETILSRTESMTMSPSRAGSRLNTNAMRKYLMSESHEEEYIKTVMEQAVVIHQAKNRQRNGLLVINDIDCEEDVDGKMDHLQFNHNEDMRENIEILDEDHSDDETLPVLPGTTTTGTANDGESVNTADYTENVYNCKDKDGYKWITIAMMQIDTQDWGIYLQNFKRNKVTENRLCDLRRGDLKELIPKIGPRNEFERLLREKLGTVSETSASAT